MAPRARLDRFDFNVTDKMLGPAGRCSDPLGCDTGKQHAALFSPKLGVVLGPWNHTTVFVNLGDGYHSNDARGVTRGGTNPEAQPVTPLTPAIGAEVGVASVPLAGWNTRLDVFLLKLQSELRRRGGRHLTERRDEAHRNRVGQHLAHQRVARNGLERGLHPGALRSGGRTG